MFSLTHDRYILVCVELLPKKFQNNKSNLPKNPICIFYFHCVCFWQFFLMVYFSECPDCIYDESKMWKIELFQNEFGLDANSLQRQWKIWRRKREGIRGTIQIFFYLILITVSLYWWIKLNIFFGYWFFEFFSCFFRHLF